jgi:hypothetical protein
MTGLLEAKYKPSVAAVVIFGDPYPKKAMSGIDPRIVDTVCSKSDKICQGVPLPVGE